MAVKNAIVKASFELYSSHVCEKRSKLNHCVTTVDDFNLKCTYVVVNFLSQVIFIFP